MKLRIRQNTLRFRLGRSDLAIFDRTGTIADKVRFGPKWQDFGYSLQKTTESRFSASFRDGEIVVRVPASQADGWANSDEVSLAGTFLADEQTELKFLIEKDFVCLDAQNNEDRSDRFPHPGGGEIC